MADSIFDEQHCLKELKHYLPSQTPLKDFIHHNSLHAFQHMKFYDAIFRASKLFGYQVTLQLNEFRQLHKTGRIKEIILQKKIAERKGFPDSLLLLPVLRLRQAQQGKSTCSKSHKHR